MLEIRRKKISDELLCIEMEGKLIYDTEEEVILLFDELATLNKHIILELSKLNYVNSSGLGLFINLLKNIKQINKKLILINPSREVTMLFEITSLDKMFEIVDDLESAKNLI